MIDYGMGRTNIDMETGIRYGVISQNEVLQAWAELSEAYYGKPDEVECPECGFEDQAPKGAEWGHKMKCSKCLEEFEIELGDFADPVSHYYDNDGYSCECGEDGDIFVMKSPYYTYGPFCSPCAPGAVYLANAADYDETSGVKGYCLGHDFFEDNKAPYKVFDVVTNEEVKS